MGRTLGVRVRPGTGALGGSAQSLRERLGFVAWLATCGFRGDDAEHEGADAERDVFPGVVALVAAVAVAVALAVMAALPIMPL